MILYMVQGILAVITRCVLVLMVNCPDTLLGIYIDLYIEFTPLTSKLYVVNI